MGDLLGSLIWGAKSRQYCVIGGGSLHNTYQLHEQTLLITLWYSRRFFRVLIDKKQGDESNMFGLKRRLETFSRIVKDSI